MSNERILLCEDDESLRVVLKLSLETVGRFRVTAVAGGREALASFALARPALVMLDVVMPEPDGLTTLAALRELPGGTEVPVVFLTGRTQREEVERLLALGAAAVLEKPFDPMTLPEQVRSHLRPHAVRSARPR